MTEKLSTLAACDQLERGVPVFSSQVAEITRGILTGMAANSELVRCSHGGDEWWIVWRQKPSESTWDKAIQMARAIATLTPTKSNEEPR